MPSARALIGTLSFMVLCAGVHSLSYGDLTFLGAECSPKDTCENATDEQRYFYNTNCECDEDCLLYGDCCIDVPQPTGRSRPRTLNVRCMKYGQPYQGVYAVDKCSRHWRGSLEIRRKCEIVDDMSDPLMAAPATDTLRGITYKNRYCAECNDVDPSTLNSWGIGLNCDSLSRANCTGDIPSDYPENNIVFKTTYPYRNTWGVHYWNETISRMDFHPCRIAFVLPDHLSDRVRYCRPDLISTCSPEWRLHVLRRQCEAYMAVVYVSSVGYRNPHCVLCNNLDLKTIACSTGLLSRSKPSMSFTLLLDVNTRDGNRVGRIQESNCPDDQKWDPFFKKCRALVCALPGFTMVNGKCVRQ